MGGRLRQAPDREAAGQHQGGLHHQQRQRPGAVGLRGGGDADQLADELQRGRQRHGARQVAAGHHRQKSVSGRHGEGADRACRQAIGDEQRIAQPVERQDTRQDQRRQGVEDVVAQEQAPRIAPVGDQATQWQEEDARRHQRHLRHADKEGVHVQHDGRQPGEQHLLDAERHEPAAEARKVDGEDGRS